MKQFQFPSLQCKQKTIGFRLLLSSLLVSSALLTACGGSNNNSNNTNDNDNTPQTNEKAPSRSSSIALTSDNRKLVVVNRQNDSVSVIEVRDAHGNDTQTLLAEIPVGKEPRYVVLAPNDNIAYITNTVDGTVSIIDLSLTVPALSGQAISVGSEPRGIAVTPNGKYVYVANHTSGNVSVIRTRDLQVVNTVTTGGNPMAIAISNDGDDDDLDEEVLVTRFFSETIDPINRPDGFDDSKQGVIDRFKVDASLTTTPAVTQLTIAPLTNSGLPADRRQFCSNTRTILQNNGDVVFFNSGVDGAGDGASKLAKDTFCPDVASVDASAEGAIGKNLQGVYPNQLYAAILRNNKLYIPNVGAAPEPPVKFNVNIQALVSALDLTTNSQLTTNLNNLIKKETQPTDPTQSLDRLFGSDIVAIDANAEGNQFLIVSRGGNYVIRASLASDGSLDIGAPNNVTRFQTGNLPSGVVMSTDGNRAYTNNELSTSVTAIDLATNQVLERDIASSTPPLAGTQKHRNLVGKLTFFTSLGVPDTHDSNGDGRFDIALRDIVPLTSRGKASDNGWSSCASCHEDGHSDNVTWIFPTGPRQAIALEGTFAKGNLNDQRILNWNAVRGSVTDFNNNSRGVQGGTGHATNVNGVNRTAEVFNHGPTTGISDALDAMTEWVANSVRAPILPDPSDTVALASGRSVFESNCSSCHGGKKWTKSQTAPLYQNNPTFAKNPLAANFFAAGKEPALDENLTVGGPQIISVTYNGVVTRFLDKVGTLDSSKALEIRGAGAIGGGVISIAGDANEGVTVAKQSTQGFASLGGAGFNSPSLLGVAYHAPYFHDGSAETLDDVFARHTLPDAGDATIATQINDTATLSNLKLFLNAIDDNTAIIP